MVRLLPIKHGFPLYCLTRFPYVHLMNFFGTIQLWLQNKKLPIYWGNRHWFDHEAKIINYGTLTRLNPKWINYRKPPYEDTSKILQDSFPEAKYRQRYHHELISDILERTVPVPQKERVCLFTSGGTASGKTSAVDELVGKTISINVDGGIRIDYDRLKKLLPEYDLMIELGLKSAAHFVQSESAKLGGKIFKKAATKGTQIIFEQTLENPKMPLEYIRKFLRKNGYEIIIVATHVTEQNGQVRAAEREKRIGRHVPPATISKIYSSVPKALFEIRDKADQIFLFDNNGTKLELMFTRDAKSGSQVINQNLYQSYLNTVGAQFDLSL